MSNRDPSKPKPIRNRAAVTDHIAAVMHEGFRDLTIDQLLTRPFDALQVGIEVAKRSGQISNRQAQQMLKWLAAIPITVGSNAQPIKEAVSEILRTALASRKRGDLKKDRY